MSIAAKFEIEYLQYLDAEGKEVGNDLPAFTKDLDQMVELYKLMVSTRVFDAKSIAMQRTGKLGTYASCLGHEAAHVGIGSAMKPEDVLSVSYREYGAQLYRGVQPREVYMYWGGDERGNDYQNEPARHDFAWSVPIGTQCLHAAGTALAFKIRNEPRVAVCCIGDGGSSKGDFYGAINIAGAQNLPLVAVIVNNQWAISVPRKIQSGAPTLAQKGIAAGLFCIQVDGNDIFAVREAMQDALDRARRGEGGSVIEAVHLSPGRSHHRRRRASLSRRARGERRLGKRADEALSYLAYRQRCVGRQKRGGLESAVRRVDGRRGQRLPGNQGSAGVGDVRLHLRRNSRRPRQTARSRAQARPEGPLTHGTDHTYRSSYPGTGL